MNDTRGVEIETDMRSETTMKPVTMILLASLIATGLTIACSFVIESARLKEIQSQLIN